MSRATRDATVLDDIERHAVALYAAGLDLMHNPARFASLKRRSRIVARLLRTTEALRTLLPHVRTAGVNPDDAADVGVVLGRAVETWDCSVLLWQEDDEWNAVTAAVAELVEIADAMDNELASLSLDPPRLRGMPVLFAPSPRRIQ